MKKLWTLTLRYGINSHERGLYLICVEARGERLTPAKIVKIFPKAFLNYLQLEKIEGRSYWVTKKPLSIEDVPLAFNQIQWKKIKDPLEIKGKVDLRNFID